MFSCEICDFFKNTYFEKHLQTTASETLFHYAWIPTKGEGGGGAGGIETLRKVTSNIRVGGEEVGVEILTK